MCTVEVLQVTVGYVHNGGESFSFFETQRHHRLTFRHVTGTTDVATWGQNFDTTTDNVFILSFTKRSLNCAYSRLLLAGSQLYT